MRQVLALVTLALSLLAGPARAASLAGVQVPDKADAGGQPPVGLGATVQHVLRTNSLRVCLMSPPRPGKNFSAAANPCYCSI